MRKLILVVCTTVLMSGTCFVANALMYSEDAVTGIQTENVKSLTSGPTIHKCLNNSRDECIKICKYCGWVENFDGTDELDDFEKYFCPNCGAK